MSPESLVDIFREALAVIVIIVSMIIVPGLIIGLVVAVFQPRPQLTSKL